METIFAPITSIISGSVITIRVSGHDSLNLLQYFNIKKHLTPRYNHLCILEIEGKTIDQAIIAYYESPNSYTGEDVIEISIHGSKYIYQTLIRELSKIPNFRFAEAGEFTKRAFINKKLDLLQAEAIDDLISSETELQANQAISQLYGKNSKIFAEFREKLIHIQSVIEAYIDFPDEDIPESKITEASHILSELKQNISNILDDKNIGNIIREGIKISIIGPPNSGKSSLINHLSGKDVAIVSNVMGTTRDAINVHLNISGFAVILTDTAGIRDTNDEVEKIGISKAVENAESSDFKILLLSAKELSIIENYQKFIDENTIIVINKIDLLQEREIQKIKASHSNACLISITENHDTDYLLNQITELITNNYKKRDTIITRERHRKLLEEISNVLEDTDFTDNLELISEKLRIVINRFGMIVGVIDIEEILDKIFSSFCIGK